MSMPLQTSVFRVVVARPVPIVSALILSVAALAATVSPLRAQDRGSRGADGMPLVAVPAGPFVMGADAPEGAPDEAPRREVRLSAYLIDRHEVTNAMFARFVASTGHRTQAEVVGYSHGYVGAEYARLDGAWWRDPDGDGRLVAADADAFPVTAVS